MNHVWSPSSLDTWQRCPQMWDWRWQHRYVTAPTDPMRFGTRIHEALQLLRHGATLPHTTLLSEADAHLHEILDRYQGIYADDPIQVLETEKLVQGRIPGLGLVKGRFDVWGQWQGEPCVMDTKTTSLGYQPDRYERYARNLQFQVYALYQRELLGVEHPVVFADLIILDHKTKRVKDEHFQRLGPYTWDDETLDALLLDLVNDTGLARMERTPQRLSQCYAGKEPCAYLPLCQAPVEARAALALDLYTIEMPH